MTKQTLTSIESNGNVVLDNNAQSVVDSMVSS